jgi:DNA-binding GntR family transcriptional regulator
MNPLTIRGTAWRALAAELRRRISAGELAPGETLPSEARLVRETGLSRTTIRQAIGQLRQEGLVTTDRPAGSVVLGRAEPVVLRPDDQATSLAPVLVIRANGTAERYPAGTRIVTG